MRRCVVIARKSRSSAVAEQCRICGRFLVSGLPGFPQPLPPGDIPGVREVCENCLQLYGPFPDKPYTPPWA